MSVHDAPEAWQAGEITSRRALDLTGAGDVLELYALADACCVEIGMHLLPAEAAAAERVGRAIDRLTAEEDAGPDMHPP